jgi:hypothetical protein
MVDFRLSAAAHRGPFDRSRHRVSCRTTDVWHLPDFLTGVEEAELTACIDAAPSHLWTRLRDRRLMHLGGNPVGALGTGIEIEPLPAWAQAICDELVRVGVFPADAPPNHILLNEYQPGQGIDAHKDGILYMPHVAILSLSSHTTLAFVEDLPSRSPVASLLLPPRGLLVFAGEAYKKHLHMTTKGIADDLERPGLVRLSGDGAETKGAACALGPLQASADERFLPRSRRLSLTVRRLRMWWEKWD